MYGAGYWSEIYQEYALINGYKIKGLVVSDEEDLASQRECDLSIYKLKDIPDIPQKCSIILALEKRHRRLIILKLNKLEYYDIM